MENKTGKGINNLNDDDEYYGTGEQRYEFWGYDEDGESCSVDNDYVKELTKTTRFLSEDFEGVEPKFEISSWS